MWEFTGLKFMVYSVILYFISSNKLIHEYNQNQINVTVSLWVQGQDLFDWVQIFVDAYWN